MITVQDIMSRLSVTEKQVEMAVYSGAIPAPDNSISNVWIDEARVRPYLDHWEKRLKLAKLRMPLSPRSSSWHTRP